MEDENGIELSLGLSCGASAGKSKGADGSTSDNIKTEEGGSNNKLMGDLETLFPTGIQKHDLDNGPQKSDLVRTQENFFTSLTKSNLEASTSKDLHGNNGPQFTRYWVANNNRSAEVEEEKLWPESGNKRKMLFEEISHQKKYADAQGKSLLPLVKTSHVSATTEDGSTIENEDVAESEAEGSTSRQVLPHEDVTKRYMSSGGSSEFSKEKHGIADLSVIDVKGQKQSNVPSGNESKHGNLTHELPFPLRPLTVMTVPYSLPNSTGVPSTSGFPGPCVMQLMPSANSERPGSQPMNPGCLPLTFGYSPVQLPTLDTDQPWGMVSHAQQFPPSFAGRTISTVPLNSDKAEDGLKISQALVQAPSHSSSEALPFDGKTFELAKGGGKQHAAEDGSASSSSQPEDVVKGNGTIYKPKEASDQPAVDGFSHEGSAIRPGPAPGLKFGGCGSYPDLPWVSTTGPGPNGRTISGVTYRYGKNEIKIVCACHGSHMSPEEFIQHASADHQNPENNAGLVSFPNGKPAASG